MIDYIEKKVAAFREKWGRFYASNLVVLDWEKPAQPNYMPIDEALALRSAYQIALRDNPPIALRNCTVCGNGYAPYTTGDAEDIGALGFGIPILGAETSGVCQFHNPKSKLYIEPA